MHQEKDNPLFSIVIPTYNTGKILDDTILSLINQKFNSYEIIVVDDGSTDGTLERLQKYKNKTQILSQTNRGSTFARNLGISKARGEYIVSFDHDDILLPYALSVYYEVVKFFNHPPLIYSRIKTFEKIPHGPDFIWNQKNINLIKFENFFKKNIPLPVINGNIIAKRESILKASGYQPDSYAYDDHRLLFRLGTESPMIAITYPVTVAYRQHIKNWSRNINYTVRGALAFIQDERNNKFPGGKKLKFDRRGLIGSNLISIFRDYLGLKNISKVIKIIFSARSMILTALIRKIFSYSYEHEKFTINTA